MVAPSISSGSPRVACIPDETALEDLLAPLFLPAYRLAFGMLRNREEAEDAVQEAALSAWRHRRGFRPGADARPWFFAMVANQCRTFRRSRWSSVLRQANPVVTRRAAKDLEADLDLRRALGQLGHDHLLTLVLRYYMDLSYEDVAATLGVSEQAARTRTQRAVRRLRPFLIRPEQLIP